MYNWLLLITEIHTTRQSQLCRVGSSHWTHVHWCRKRTKLWSGFAMMLPVASISRMPLTDCTSKRWNPFRASFFDDVDFSQSSDSSSPEGDLFIKYGINHNTTRSWVLSLLPSPLKFFKNSILELHRTDQIYRRSLKPWSCRTFCPIFYQLIIKPAIMFYSIQLWSNCVPSTLFKRWVPERLATAARAWIFSGSSDQIYLEKSTASKLAQLHTVRVWLWVPSTLGSVAVL